MDVNSIKNLLVTNKAPSRRVNNGEEFGKVFEQKIAEVNSSQKISNSDARIDVLEHGSRLLDLLDDYAGDLENPHKTLKNIEPLVEAIRNEADMLQKQAAAKAQDGGDLEKIVEDLAVTANVATLKFTRGDFV